MGAWIEIKGKDGKYYNTVSLLSWERGLKSDRGVHYGKKYMVAPLVGAWIEI